MSRFAVEHDGPFVVRVLRVVVGAFCRKMPYRVVLGSFLQVWFYLVVVAVFLRTVLYEAPARWTSSHRQGATTSPSGRRAQTFWPTAKGHPRALWPVRATD